MKVNEVLAMLLLSYGSDAWPVRKQDEWCLTSAEMKFLRKTAGYSPLDHKKLMTADLKITSQQNNYNYTDETGCSLSVEWNFPEYQVVCFIAFPKGDSTGRPPHGWREWHVTGKDHDDYDDDDDDDPKFLIFLYITLC
jgi:hypothetical protein